MGKRKGKKPARSLRRRARKNHTSKEVECFVSAGHYVFWLAHGANYLASSLEEGLWKPIFNIYRGQPYTQQRILFEATSRYQTSEGKIEDPGVAVLAWCGLKPDRVFDFCQGLHEKATPEQRVCLRQPHVEYVWKSFQLLHNIRL